MKSSEKGSIFLILIFAVIIFFSISLVSGATKFQYSPESSSPISSSPTATPGTNGTPVVSPSPADNQWNISYTITSCENGLATGVITTTSLADGYVVLETQDGSGSYLERSSDVATSPTQSLGLELVPAWNHAASPWRLRLYEGGSGTKDNYSGGTLRNTIEGTPTGCT